MLDIIAKGTRVDGVYTSDPEKMNSCKKIEQISIDEVYTVYLSVMDMTAFTLCIKRISYQLLFLIFMN